MDHGHDDFAFEPVPGLPERLPAGEHLLWQGAPRWQALARDAFHVRALAVYFGVLLAWVVVSALYDGQPVAGALMAVAVLAPLAVAALALVVLFAWLVERTTVYSITNRRVVMRFGIALPITVNVPYAIVESVGLTARADGTGDLPLNLNTPDRIAYLHLWPHARPWRIAKPAPMLRAVPDAAAVGNLLSQALADSVGGVTHAPVFPAPARASATLAREWAADAQ